MSNAVMTRSRRPQLTDTIERLERMIDDLATAIPGAVAESVREVLATVLPEVVKAAVERAATELAAAVAVMTPTAPAPPAPPPPPPPPAPPETPGLSARFRAWTRRIQTRLVTEVRKSRDRAVRAWMTGRLLLALVPAFVAASPRVAIGSTLAGTVVGVGAYHLGPIATAVMAGSSVGLLVLGGLWLAPFVPLARMLVSSRDGS
jgi:hypothetical protein